MPYGVELEYMIVDAGTLDAAPIADRILIDDAGAPCNALVRGDIGWSNELVRHVIELKTAHPAEALDGLAERFQRAVGEVAARLQPHGARLLPTAMHPWFDPERETNLWVGDDREIYAAFDAIFGCRGHGWSNLQSVHLNLPFHSDDEFRRLHAAIRVALPLLPALAASSPIQERSPSGFLDARLEAYRHNCARVPLVTGHVIPELARSPAEYDERILQPMYRAIAPLDPGGVLQDEWLNARGAIARFDRNTIEIRVLDIQECPAQDLALLGFIDALLRALQCGALSPLDEQEALGERALEQIFLRAIRDGRFAPAIDAAWLRALGLDGKTKSLGDAAAALMHRLGASDAWWGDGVRFILRSGSLAERILGAMSQGEPLPAIYRRLAESLAGGIRFEASANA